MNLQQLKYVHAVSEKGSFVAAAAHCAVTQPTLSNAIAQLEMELGQRIFNRTTRSVSLTAFGETLLPLAKQVLMGVSRIHALAEKHDRGETATINVGFSPVVGITQATDVLHSFAITHTDVDIIYREENLDDLCKLLRNHQLDIVIAPVDLRSPDFADCGYALIQRDPLLFVPNQSQQHEWSGRQIVDLADLAQEEFVLVPDACGLTRVTKRHFNDHNLTLHRYPGEASSYRVVGEWAALGLGSGILPLSKVEKEDAARIAIPITTNGEPLTIDYYLFGKPNTISAELFSKLWQTLIEAWGELHPDLEMHDQMPGQSVAK